MLTILRGKTLSGVFNSRLNPKFAPEAPDLSDSAPFSWPRIPRPLPIVSAGQSALLVGPKGQGKTSAILDAVNVGKRRTNFQVFDMQTDKKNAAELLDSVPFSTCLVVLHAEGVKDVETLAKASLVRPVVLEINNGWDGVWAVEAIKGDNKPAVLPDWTEEQVRLTFFPRLISSEPQFSALLRICGGRLSLLKTLSAALLSLEPKWLEQKRKEAEDIRSGRKKAKPEETVRLSIDGLTLAKDELFEAIGSGSSCFGDEMRVFELEMDKLKSTFQSIEGRVLLMESIRWMIKKFFQIQEPVPITSLASSTHPVILGLLRAGILFPGFSPDRLEPSSNLQLRFLEAWIVAEEEAMTLSERILYNTAMLRYRTAIIKQLEGI